MLELLDVLDDVGMFWPLYLKKSRSHKRNGKIPSRFEFIFLGEGKLMVRFLKVVNQTSNENH